MFMFAATASSSSLLRSRAVTLVGRMFKGIRLAPWQCSSGSLKVDVPLLSILLRSGEEKSRLADGTLNIHPTTLAAPLLTFAYTGTPLTLK
jgi:hypothetical protein